jgi:hypothetical protein
VRMAVVVATGTNFVHADIDARNIRQVRWNVSCADRAPHPAPHENAGTRDMA